MAHDNTCPPAKVEEVVDYYDVNRLQLILEADANAHHLLWGSSDIRFHCGTKPSLYKQGTQAYIFHAEQEGKA